MLAAIYSYLDSPWWTATTLASLVWGVAGIIGVLFAGKRTRKQSIGMWTGIGFLVFTVVFSMLFEELVPLARQTSWLNAARVGAGMAGFFIAICAFVYAGRLILSAILGGARWTPALLWLSGSIALFGLSTIVYHGFFFT